MKQLGFYIDSSKCTGCKTCQLACKDYRDLDVKRNYRRIYEYTGGGFVQDGDTWIQNDVFAYYLSIACNHCTHPACVQACPSGAMHKRDDNGLVLVDEDICIGCQHCANACPYGAPQFDKTRGIMTKCDGCIQRLSEGKQPMCVESCPLRALEFGDMSELREKYGLTADVAPLPPSSQTLPNIVIKLNKNSKPTGDTTGFLVNPKEV